MSIVTFEGREYQETDLVNVARKIQANIIMLEAVQYSSRHFTDDLEHIGRELRDGLDDNAISELRYYLGEIEDAIGKVRANEPTHTTPEISIALEKMTGIRAGELA